MSDTSLVSSIFSEGRRFSETREEREQKSRSLLLSDPMANLWATGGLFLLLLYASIQAAGRPTDSFFLFHHSFQSQNMNEGNKKRQIRRGKCIRGTQAENPESWIWKELLITCVGKQLERPP